MHRQLKTLCAVFLAIGCIGVTEVIAQSEQQRTNVLIIVADDIGYMDFGSYGGEAMTPSIDAIAKRGIKMSRYYTSPQCSPSRAMLLTGADNHEIGMAMIAETLPQSARNHPAYTMTFPEGTLTLADRLGDAGYQTYAVGKWGIGDVGANLPRKHGFDRSLIFDATGADNWTTRPYIPIYETIEWFEDDRPVERPNAEYSSKLFVDRMIEYIDNGESDRPFFGYLAFQAVHIPVQAPREFTDNYNGRFDDGWHALRQERFERAKELGLISSNAVLPLQPQDARAWDDLDDSERALLARAMQVNAGMIEAMDHHLERLFSYLEDSGQLENTLVIIVSDNGPESGYLIGQNPLMDRWLRKQGYTTELETLGEQDSMIAIGMEWATAAAVPFSRYKFHSTEGGHRVPLIIAGPGLQPSGFNPARAHVFDITPTVLDLVGLPARSSDGEAVPIRGRSLVPVLTGLQDEVYGSQDAVGMEVAANAALYKGDWKLQRMPKPSGDGQWHLYDLENDPGESKDLQQSHPEIFEELLNDYDAYAQEVSIIDLGPDYNPFKLVGTQIARPLLKDLLPVLLAGIAITVIVVWMSIRLWRSRRFSSRP